MTNYDTQNKLENLVAILSEDIVTLEVEFQPTSKLYKYKCHKSISETLKIDDVVVVETRDTYSVAKVKTIDEEALLQPDDTLAYRWVVQKVDFSLVQQLKTNEREKVEQLAGIQRQSAKANLLRVLGLSNEQTQNFTFLLDSKPDINTRKKD